MIFFVCPSLGDVSPISMSPISQSQFIPLGEILCLAISAMNSARKPVTQDALMEHLATCFPGSPPDTLMNTHTQTHTHTHTCWFYGLRRLFISVMVFILYKPYFLSPYNNPTPKPTPYRKLCAFLLSQKKNEFCMIYKRFELPYVIPMSLYKFVSS